MADSGIERIWLYQWDNSSREHHLRSTDTHLTRFSSKHNHHNGLLAPTADGSSYIEPTHGIWRDETQNWSFSTKLPCDSEQRSSEFDSNWNIAGWKLSLRLDCMSPAEILRISHWTERFVKSLIWFQWCWINSVLSFRSSNSGRARRKAFSIISTGFKCEIRHPLIFDNALTVLTSICQALLCRCEINTRNVQLS